MLIFDQLKKSDRPLQLLAAAILLSMLLLLAGLWYVQVLSTQRYRNNLQVQSFRTVRVPAVRGKILDRNRIPLAENRPSYNLNLFLEELRPLFRAEYTNRVRKEYLAANTGLTNVPRGSVPELERQARYRVVSNLLLNVSASLQDPRLLIERHFHNHYDSQRSLPYPLLRDLSATQVAAFSEKSGHIPSLDLDVQPIRAYPHKSLASHVLGHLRRDDTPQGDEELPVKFLLPDYVGVSGIEAFFDKELRGQAGVRSVLVNSMAYRQREEMLLDPQPGQNVVLTIDYYIQQATERALGGAESHLRAAAVVMDVRSGDILAMASAPTFDPSLFLGPIPPAEWERLSDEKLHPMFNNAAYGIFPAGSTFKIVDALAALECGELDPEEIYHSKGYFQLTGRSRPIRDTAGEGNFNFEKAFYLSSNPYFIEHGLRIGPEKLIEMGRRFRLGERTGLPTRQEASGFFPPAGRLRSRDGSPWTAGDTANLCIGQGDIEVTPLQMVSMVAAVANGGTLLQPRLVAQVEPQETPTPEHTTTFPARVVRGDLRVSRRSLDILTKAMLADVENPLGSGRRAALPNLRICGKTGTAQTPTREYVVWFVSYAPYENPRYAVAVVVTGGSSGGGTCAPIARDIYQGIVKREAMVNPTQTSLVANP